MVETSYFDLIKETTKKSYAAIRESYLNQVRHLIETAAAAGINKAYLPLDYSNRNYTQYAKYAKDILSKEGFKIVGTTVSW